MTETTRKGWVMVSRHNHEFVVECSFQARLRDAVAYLELHYQGHKPPRHAALRHYKPVKCTMTIKLDER